MVAFKATKSASLHYKIFAVQKVCTLIPVAQKKSQPFWVASFLQLYMYYKTKKETAFTVSFFRYVLYLFYGFAPQRGNVAA